MKNEKNTSLDLQTVENWDKSTVPINTAFNKVIVRKLNKYKKDKGLLTEQDVIRLAVGSFLDKSGY